MATLEKIRQRSTLLLIVVGVALLAFIIGDFFTSGRTLFGNGTTIATVGDSKIDIQDFQRRYEEYSQRVQQQNAKMDPAMMQQQVLGGMIEESLIEQELEALGIVVTDDELSKSMLGAEAHPYMYQFAQQLGAQTPDQVWDFAFNPVKYNVPAETSQQLQALWLQQEKQMEAMLRMQKLQNLLAGAIVANDLDARSLYDAGASTRNVAYVYKNYSSLPDEEYPVESADIKKAYDQFKNTYRVPEETRRGNYIAVNIAPSVEDKAAAQALVDSTVALLASTPEIEAVSGDVNFGVDRKKTTAAAISNTLLRQFVTDSVVGAVKNISYIDDEFTIAKILGKKMETDSINVDFIVYQGTAAGRDSVMAALKAGKPFAEVAAMPGVADSRSDLWQTLTAMPDGEMKTMLADAPQGYFYLDSTDTQARIARVNSKKAPVQVYDYATVTYKVYPSEATIERLNDDLAAFVATVANADSLTAEKAMAAGYALMPAYVTEDSYMIGNVPYSRKAVKWMMDAKAGQVSPIIENSQNDYLVVAALNEVIEPGIMPLSNDNVRRDMTTRAIVDKKAAAMMEKYNGKATSLEGYAREMDAQVDTVQVVFGQMFNPMFGPSEPGFIGVASVSPEGKLSDVFKGDTGVFVYQVASTDNESRPYSYDESAARFSQEFGSQAVMQRLVDMLKSAKDVENRMLQFYTE